jgi:hypothetical protein
LMPSELYALAENEGIIVRDTVLPSDILGVYYSVCGKSPVILLHKKVVECKRLTRSILAEELGHHFTCGINLIAFARQQRYITEKYERLALWWATKYLLPWEELVGAVMDEKIFLIPELAEHFNITERFMWTSLELYDEKIPRKMHRLNKLLNLQEGFAYGNC